MFNLKAISEKVLNSYGWSIQDIDEPFDTTIYPGEYVWFWDDFSEQWAYGVYEGFYSDFNKAKETSPYFNEADQLIDRLVVTDSVINPDGSLTERRNFALVENVYEGYCGTTDKIDFTKATNTPMSSIEAIA